MNTSDERMGIWGPGVWLARQSRLPVKLGMLAVVLLIPLIVVIVLLVQRQSSELSRTPPQPVRSPPPSALR